MHPVVALIVITVVMSIQSAFEMVLFRKRKLMYSEIQTMFDQALFQTETVFLKIADGWIHTKYNTRIGNTSKLYLD